MSAVIDTEPMETEQILLWYVHRYSQAVAQAEINAETVREQQREIARLQGLLAEILADDKACGYLNASLTRRIHQLMGNTS